MKNGTVKIPRYASVICFHGKPRPHTVTDKNITKFWKYWRLNILMATINYKCDQCKRETELVENSTGFTIIGKCNITEGCRLS